MRWPKDLNTSNATNLKANENKIEENGSMVSLEQEKSMPAMATESRDPNETIVSSRNPTISPNETLSKTQKRRMLVLSSRLYNLANEFATCLQEEFNDGNINEHLFEDDGKTVKITHLFSIQLIRETPTEDLVTTPTNEHPNDNTTDKVIENATDTVPTIQDSTTNDIYTELSKIIVTINSDSQLPITNQLLSFNYNSTNDKEPNTSIPTKRAHPTYESSNKNTTKTPKLDELTPATQQISTQDINDFLNEARTTPEPNISSPSPSNNASFEGNPTEEPAIVTTPTTNDTVTLPQENNPLSTTTTTNTTATNTHQQRKELQQVILENTSRILKETLCSVDHTDSDVLYQSFKWFPRRLKKWKCSLSQIIEHQ